MKRIIVVVLTLSSTACGLVADASAEAETEAQRHRAAVRWQSEATVLATCPEGAKREGRRCGLLSDGLSPAETTAALPGRYPYASIVEMRGTCGLDPSCDVRRREMVWLESHNRNVARVAEDRQLEEDSSRRRRLGVAERIVAVIAISGAVVAIALGASIR